MANPQPKKYPALSQRRTMWASLTAIFLVALKPIDEVPVVRKAEEHAVA